MCGGEDRRLGELAPRHLVSDIGHPVIVELGDLLLLLGDRLPRFCDIRVCIGNLPFKTVGRALQLQDSRARGEQGIC